MEADFGGYVTRSGIKCTDGLIIAPNAFEHQDGMKVPLVWQHNHTEPSNILGYTILKNRPDGVYGESFFNDTEYGKMAKRFVQHGDVEALSIYASGLTKNKDRQVVLHGNIKEVSLVIAGANPGAFIDVINLAHSDGDIDDMEMDVLIYTGYALDVPEDSLIQHADKEEVIESVQELDKVEAADLIEHKDQEITITQGETMVPATDTRTVQDVFDTLSEEQKNVVYFMIGEALSQDQTAKHSNDSEDNLQHDQGETYMSRNVFEQNGAAVDTRHTLSHSQVKDIVNDAVRLGSLKESFLAHAQDYGIENIDFLFPDARTLSNSPEILSRRTEWVSTILIETKHSPFSRIKGIVADLTADEARAKGYVKGAMKKDEIIKLLKRVTTPTTVYKKQKLDRDDVVDITDLDVIAWLKAEMRLGLDEEIARAILIGDGREPDDADKIDEDHLRPIAFDDSMYTHSVTIPSNVAGQEIVEAVLRARTYYKGSGNPVMFTTDAILTDLMLIKDKVDRRLYETEAALTAALRVSKIVTVDVMDSVPDVLAIIVNLADYTIGADHGGAVSMFDDFDLDYNQLKYLIESRISGALTKPKSAVVIKRDAGTLVTPTSPSFAGETNTITIPTVTGVVYKIDDVTKTGTVVITETTEVEAFPATGYAFPHNTNTDWTYIYTA